LIDLLLTVVLVGSAVMGYRRGALLGLLMIVALAAAIAAGVTVGSALGRSAGMVVFIVIALVAVLASSRRREDLDAWVENMLEDGLRQFDRAAGAVLHVALIASLIWFVGAVMSFVPARTGLPAALRDSVVVDFAVNTVSPTSDFSTRLLRSGLVPALDGPVVITDEPDGAILDDPDIIRARASVVRILGESCGNSVSSGTGWVVAADLIATNAHVVAGHRETRVALNPRAPGLPVRVVAMDPHNDLAILRLPNLVLRPLPRVTAADHGTPMAVVGFPRQFEQQLTPVRFDRMLDYPLRDIYNNEPARPARLAVFRGSILEGNSGSPLLTPDGSVLATVTSAAVEQSVDGGYGASNEALTALLTRAGHQAVSTGPCLKSHTARRLG
jgi:S1-C subfamily serine protease